jgi:hypothetical protein
MAEIQRADPSVRRQTVIWVGIIFVAGLALLALVERGPIAQSPLALGIITVLVAAPLPAFAAYFWRLGRRIARAERYPAPGMRVIHDTVVLTGDVARRRGRLLQALAVIVMAALIGMAAIVARLFWLLSNRG